MLRESDLYLPAKGWERIVLAASAGQRGRRAAASGLLISCRARLFAHGMSAAALTIRRRMRGRCRW